MAQMAESLLQAERRAPACPRLGSEGWREGELLTIMLQMCLPQKNAKIIKIKKKKVFLSRGAAETHYFLNKSDFHRELMSPESPALLLDSVVYHHSLEVG